MADKLQVSIIGLGMLGASAGLALHRFQDRLTIVGHDRSPDKSGLAKKAGAVDRTEWNLINAVRKADRILLALPLDETRDTLKAIGQDLQEGCVILDTCAVKEPVMRWAAEYLPAGVHFVGGHPIVMAAEGEEPRADLFERRLFCLAPASSTDASAVNLAADLAESLGAQPFFLDAAEHDGMAASVWQLPALLSGALLHRVTSGAGWKDVRKVAGSQFFAGTHLSGAEGKDAAAGLAANREHLLRALDALTAELAVWRGLVDAGDEVAMTRRFEGAMAERQGWLSAFERANWDEDPNAPPLPTSSSIWRDLIGFGRRRASDTTKRK